MRYSSLALASAVLAASLGSALAAPSASSEGKTALWCSAAYVIAAQTDKAKSDPAMQAEIMDQSGALSRLARATLAKDGFTDDQIKAMIDKTSMEVVEQFSAKAQPSYSREQCMKVLSLAK